MITQKHYTDIRLEELQAQIDRRAVAHEHQLDVELEALRKELSITVQAQKEAREKAELALNRRLETMNEFRGVLSDQQSKYVTIDRYEERHEELDRRVDVLELWRSNIIGRSIAIAFIGSLLVAGLTVLLYHVI